MEGTILPELARARRPGPIVSRTLRCAGIGESRVAERSRDLFEASPNPSVAYLASASEVKVRLTAKAETEERGRGDIGSAGRRGPGPSGRRRVHRRRRRARGGRGSAAAGGGWTLACAESLTGGGVGARLTSVAGASDYFVGSAVVYTADAKRNVLGVSGETIDGPGS